MAELALEYIVKITILLVAAGVILGLILTFGDDIGEWWKGFSTSTTLPKAQIIERAAFTADEVARFIEGCWSTHQGTQKDDECYFLLGDFSRVAKGSIIANLDMDIITQDKVIFEFTVIGNALAITYDNYRSEANSEAIVVKG